MNERIIELANKAAIFAEAEYAKQTMATFDTNKSTQELYEEKFAELLIQECITVVEDMSPGYKDYRDQIEDAFRRDCIFEIKHKFGLPE